MAQPPATSNRSSPAKTYSGSVKSGIGIGPQKVVIYGPGGVGKSKLASLIALRGKHPLFIDLERGSRFLDVPRIDDIDDWDALRGVLQSDSIMGQFDTVVVDSLTKAQEMTEPWIIANIKHEKNKPIVTISDYGWGKEQGHIYDAMLRLLGDLDGLNRKGMEVICIAHDCTASVPNPGGEDWIRYEPRLQSPKSGHNSVRHRIKEWCDHMIFVGFDQVVSDDGKAKGGGTRTIYPVEMPTHWAKSRSLSQPFEYKDGDPKLWELLGI